MKRLMMTAAALALLTTTAFATEEQTLSGAIAATAVYDQKCEVLPIDFKDTVRAAMSAFPPDVLRDALRKVQDFYGQVGHDAFCSKTKSVVDAAMRNAGKK